MHDTDAHDHNGLTVISTQHPMAPQASRSSQVMLTAASATSASSAASSCMRYALLQHHLWQHRQRRTQRLPLRPCLSLPLSGGQREDSTQPFTLPCWLPEPLLPLLLLLPPALLQLPLMLLPPATLLHLTA